MVEGALSDRVWRLLDSNSLINLASLFFETWQTTDTVPYHVRNDTVHFAAVQNLQELLDRPRLSDVAERQNVRALDQRQVVSVHADDSALRLLRALEEQEWIRRRPVEGGRGITDLPGLNWSSGPPPGSTSPAPRPRPPERVPAG